jgi:mono/diheme cytochrome c family protein
MMKIPTPCTAVLVSALLFSTATLAMAQETGKKIKQAPIAVTSAGSGEEMFNTYCAVCHGKGGKGDGPAASEFKIPPANLTLLAQTHEGKYPSAYVSQVIETGPRNAKAHGSKDMPVWGTLFRAIGDGEQAKLRIHNLTAYIETLQAK